MENEKTSTLSVTKKMGVCHVLNDQGGQSIGVSEDIVNTLRAEAHGNIPCVVENHPQDGRVKINEDGIVQTLASTMGMGGGYSLNYQNPVRINYAVRRLTPTECARLQGFPSTWCSDIPHSDTAEYKMWGNGIALPCAAFVLNGVAAELRKSDTARENT